MVHSTRRPGGTERHSASLAQLASALPLHGRGRGFESLTKHFRKRQPIGAGRRFEPGWASLGAVGVRLSPLPLRWDKPIGDGSRFEGGRGASPWEFDSPSHRAPTLPRGTTRQIQYILEGVRLDEERRWKRRAG